MPKTPEDMSNGAVARRVVLAEAIRIKEHLATDIAAQSVAWLVPKGAPAK